MNEFKLCPKCGEYHFLNNSCPDIYIIHDPDYSEKGFEVRGSSFDNAIQKYARLRELMPTKWNPVISVENKTTGEKIYCEIKATIEYETTSITEI